MIEYLPPGGARRSERRLVREVLTLAEARDIVDAIHDLETATAILRARFERMTTLPLSSFGPSKGES